MKTKFEIIRKTLESVKHMISDNRLTNVLKALDDLEKCQISKEIKQKFITKEIKQKFISQMLVYGSELEKSNIPLQNVIIINDANILYDSHLKEIKIDEKI